MQLIKDLKPSKEEIDAILKDAERYYYTYIRSGWLR